MQLTYLKYGRIDGANVIIRIGSIGKGTLPFIERQFEYYATQLVIIDLDPEIRNFLSQHAIRHVQVAVTKKYREVLGDFFPNGKGFL